MYKLFIFSLVSLYANFSFGAVCDTVIVGNGIRYEGQYPCGEGVLYSDSLGIYIGHFERGIPNGVCTHYKRTGTATTANSRMASIPGGVYSSGNREWYASVISKTDTVLERIRSGTKVYLCRSLRKRQTERRRHIIYPQGFRT